MGERKADRGAILHGQLCRRSVEVPAGDRDLAHRRVTIGEGRSREEIYFTLISFLFRFVFLIFLIYSAADLVSRWGIDQRGNNT